MIMVMAMVLSLAVSLAACGNDAPAPTYPVITAPTLPSLVTPTLPSLETPDVPDVPDVTEPQVTEPEVTEPEEVTIVGEWAAEVDLAPMFNMIFVSMAGEEIAEYIALDSFEVVQIMTFDDDGEFTMVYEEDSFMDSLEDAMDVWKDGYTSLIEDQIAASGKDITVEEAAQEALGMSIDEYIESIAESFDPDSLSGSGEYELDDDELYLDDSGNYYTIRLTEDEFEFVDYSDEDAIDMEIFGNVEFERQ